MANKKDKSDEQPNDETRKRVPVTHRYNPDILDAIELYAESQDAPPSELTCLEAAAIEWLRKRNFWPLAKAKESHKAALKAKAEQD